MDTTDLLVHPAFVSVIAPGIVALFVGLMLAAARATRTAIALGAIVGASVGALLLLGAPVPPYRSALDKLALIVPLGGVIMLLVPRGVSNRKRFVAAVGFVWLACVWLASPQLTHVAVIVALVLLALLLAVLPRQASMAPRFPSRLVLGAGVCASAFAAGSLVLAQSAMAISAALAGATLGAMLGSVLGSRFGSSSCASTIGPGRSILPREPAIADELFTYLGMLSMLALMIVLLTEAVPWTIAPLLLVLPCAGLARHMPAGARPSGNALWQLVVCALPAILAVVLVLLGAPGDDAYYQ